MTWYCWYSETRSFMLDSASVNSISSMPSPVYQWRKALRLNIAVNCSEIRLKISWMAVLFKKKRKKKLKFTQIKPQKKNLRVADESSSHLESPGWNVTNGGLDVIRNPFNEVRRVLVLNIQHLLIDFLHGHASTEDGGDGQVTTVARVAGSHHVLSIEHLRNGKKNRLLFWNRPI